MVVYAQYLQRYRVVPVIPIPLIAYEFYVRIWGEKITSQMFHPIRIANGQ